MRQAVRCCPDPNDVARLISVEALWTAAAVAEARAAADAAEAQMRARAAGYAAGDWGGGDGDGDGAVDADAYADAVGLATEYQDETADRKADASAPPPAPNAKRCTCWDLLSSCFAKPAAAGYVEAGPLPAPVVKPVARSVWR
jgi:hypothetical protein